MCNPGIFAVKADNIFEYTPRFWQCACKGRGVCMCVCFRSSRVKLVLADGGSNMQILIILYFANKLSNEL